MITTISDKELALDFARSFVGDIEFSDPMLSNDGQVECNLLKFIWEPERYRTIGVYQNDTLIGLFVYLITAEEKYVEMIVGLSNIAL